MIPGPRGVWTKKPVRAVEGAGMARDGVVLSCCLDRIGGAGQLGEDRIQWILDLY